ncbi:hypothetical protein ALC60_09501 [Trachymyrmex zeteki]|uniref:Uncharacterized protein n=1 Tax=Mycetomoellerius zeteki TaxID=64791 RepID=A0A151WU18_9HYME|nr:hypothetical protein ALC60_09501 [Trachymyrmex zeteki]
MKQPNSRCLYVAHRLRWSETREKMREIMDLILAPKLQKETCNLLRVLVSEFHMMFAELFPSERFTPKSHNFVHYGTIFQFSGPIRNLSTIRFEAKHKNKKKEANATTSRRNITHTLCIKEQLSLCYRLMTHKGLESNNSYGMNEYVEHVSLCHDYILFKSTLPYDFNNACLIMKWVEVHGQTYRKGTCVVIRCKEHYLYDSLPVFGLVKSILRNKKDRICLICQIILTLNFDTYLHAYVVQKSEQIECVIIDELLTPFPAILVSLGKDLTHHKLYVTLKHAL